MCDSDKEYLRELLSKIEFHVAKLQALCHAIAESGITYCDRNIYIRILFDTCIVLLECKEIFKMLVESGYVKVSVN